MSEIIYDKRRWKEHIIYNFRCIIPWIGKEKIDIDENEFSDASNYLSSLIYDLMKKSYMAGFIKGAPINSEEESLGMKRIGEEYFREWEKEQ